MATLIPFVCENCKHNIEAYVHGSGPASDEFVCPWCGHDNTASLRRNQKHWTVADVRSALPNVQVRFRQAGKPATITCLLSGRQNKFATVRPFEIGSATAWTFSWDAIAASLNSGKPLIV